MSWRTDLARLRRLAIVVAAASVTATGSAFAADPSSESGPSPRFYGDPGAPDISGLWLGTLTAAPGQTFAPGRGPADGRPPTYWAPWPLPYTPTYQKIYDDRVEAAKKGKQLGDLSAQCLPFGMPKVLVAKVYPDEIVQTPGEVTLFMYGAFPIVVWTDGRAHPKDLKPSYNGHSVGYWQDGALVVDTVGVLGATPIDTARDPHGPGLHIKWSIEKVAADTLHLHVTLYDEVAFTEPVTTTNIWRRKTEPQWDVLDDASCFENNTPSKTTPDGFSRF